jgi:hypothetical protein
MKKILLGTLLIASTSVVMLAKDTDSNKTKPSIETNATTKAEKQLQKQIEREKKFAKEKTFYKGPEYDLSYAEIDPKSLDSIEAIEPDLDFDMDDVYD